MKILTQEKVLEVNNVQEFKDKLYGFLQQDSLEALYEVLVDQLTSDTIIDLRDMGDSVYVTQKPMDIDAIVVTTKYGRTLSVLRKFLVHTKHSQNDYEVTLNSMSITTV